MNSKIIIAGCASLASLTLAAAAPAQSEAKRPNVVWFLTEDLSPHFLSLFNDGKGCETPNLAALAGEGMLYPNAYSSAPVSSAARTTLITGCYAPSFAGSFHRHIELNPRPEGLRLFPSYLKDAGYYTINAKKTDYNVELNEGAWDDMKGELDTWRKRPDMEQPFFMQRSVMTTHESKLLFTEDIYKSVKTRHNPADVFLLPHVPDTDLMRYTYATIYDRIEESDAELGELVEMLKADGELDNTIIFFFGDNGGTTPGTKGYTDNVGVQVPLVVYVPEKLRAGVDAEAGVVREDIVSFIDFAATTLNMVGLKAPKQMDGVPFIGKGARRENRSTVCYGDRFDELYSFNRSIRRGDMRYERNYQPYQSQSLFALYRYMQMAFREWKELYEAGGKLNATQSRFFEPQGVEELYDLSRDPNEEHNLASDPKYKKQLEALRREMNSYLLEKCDLSFLPECVIHEEAMANPSTFGQANRARIKRYMSLADLQRLPFAEAKGEIAKALSSADAVDAWWALTDAAWFGMEAKELMPKAEQLLSHERSFVRSKAMLFLLKCGKSYTPAEIKGLFKGCRKDAETLLILNDVAVMVESGLVAPFPITVADAPAENFSVEWRVRYLNALYDGTPLSVICDKNFGKKKKK
ncbi:MAG: sulfatase [Rikenellaceae bacterium]